MGFYPFAAAAVSPVPWLPADNSLLAAAGDPVLFNAGFLTIAGTVYLSKIPVRNPTLASNVWAVATVAGVGASTGSFGGLYSSAGALLSGSADAGGLVLGAGAVEIPLSTPQQLAAGFVWAAFLFNLATTQPTLARSSAFGNVGLSAALSRFAVPVTGQTSLPGSFSPGSLTPEAATFWAGIS
jgi:hypothetical protein